MFCDKKEQVENLNCCDAACQITNGFSNYSLFFTKNIKCIKEIKVNPHRFVPVQKKIRDEGTAIQALVLGENRFTTVEKSILNFDLTKHQNLKIISRNPRQQIPGDFVLYKTGGFTLNENKITAAKNIVWKKRERIKKTRNEKIIIPSSKEIRDKKFNNDAEFLKNSVTNTFITNKLFLFFNIKPEKTLFLLLLVI